jgi:hypothetical protein
MPERADTIRRIRSLRALAASSNEHEAQLAATMAERLIAQYQIGDDELEEAEQEEMVFFGHKLFFFSKQIKPHLLAMKAEIAAAKA